MVRASVTEIYDLSTQTGKSTVLKVHTPIGQNIKRHLVGHFLQYKRYRYVGAKVSLVPASTLPADPLQLSYEAGEPTIDPRDMVNPILWKHYHGEAMITDGLTNIDDKDYSEQSTDPESVLSYFGNSLDRQEIQGNIGTSGSRSEYFAYAHTLMDDSFRRSSVQTGFSTFVKPFAYNLATNFQISCNSSDGQNTGSSQAQMHGRGARYSDAMVSEGTEQLWNDELSNPTKVSYRTVKADDAVLTNPGSFFTNKLTRLGWLDTTQNALALFNAGQDLAWPGTGDCPTMVENAFCNANLPYVPMLYVMLPPAYKTEFYFRLVIKHLFEFGGFRSAFSVQSWGKYQQAGWWPVDANATAATAMVAKALSEMILDSDGPADSVEVENGNIIPMADGASGS